MESHNFEEKKWNNNLIYIHKINTRRNLNMQIDLQIKDNSCRPQHKVSHTKLKEKNMALTKEMLIETMKRIVKLISNLSEHPLDILIPLF